MEQTLQLALKEWHLICQALLDGRQAILLRKGGILESAGEFELEHSRFLLFPTYIHQNPAHVKPQFRHLIEARATEPEQVQLDGWAEVAAIFQVPLPERGGPQRLALLADLHLWDQPLLDMRFAYRPEKPLYLLAVRGWRLPKPVTIPNTPEYAGCKSWVPLAAPVDLTGSAPAFEESELAEIVTRLQETLRI